MLVSGPISVIIPAYNSAATIGKAIESVLAQTLQPVEVLVVDDGSLDCTAEVVSRFDTPVRLIRRENGGPGAARNSAARQAKGDWLALLDADDTWLPNKLERQADYTFQPEYDVILGLGHLSDAPQYPTFDDIWNRNTIATSTALIRRSRFEAVGGFDEDRRLIGVEDWNLWLRMAAAGAGFVVSPDRLHKYSPAEGNLSSQVERILEADLVNVDKIARLLGLSDRKVRIRTARFLEECGRDLLHARSMTAARSYFLRSLRFNPSRACVAGFVASLMPVGLLQLRRRIVHDSSGAAGEMHRRI